MFPTVGVANISTPALSTEADDAELSSVNEVFGLEMLQYRIERDIRIQGLTTARHHAEKRVRVIDQGAAPPSPDTVIEDKGPGPVRRADPFCEPFDEVAAAADAEVLRLGWKLKEGVVRPKRTVCAQFIRLDHHKLKKWMSLHSEAFEVEKAISLSLGRRHENWEADSSVAVLVVGERAEADRNLVGVNRLKPLGQDVRMEVQAPGCFARCGPESHDSVGFRRRGIPSQAIVVVLAVKSRRDRQGPRRRLSGRFRCR